MIPVAFADWITQSRGDVGSAWIRSLPGHVECLCRQWHIELDGSVMHGGSGIALPVRRGNRPLMLKLSVDQSTHAIDVLALSHWAGRGMVVLHEHAQESSALLLERLGAESLADQDWRTAIEVCGDLIRQCAIPGCHGIPTVADLATAIASNLDRYWNELDRPMSRTRIDKALAIITDRGADPTDLMVNWDLYPGNVVEGIRQPWTVIDPKPARGAPEFGAAPIFWRTIDEIDSEADFAWTCDALTKRGDLDRLKLIEWTFVRVVDYWFWALSRGLTEDPVRCSRVVDLLELELKKSGR